MPEDATRASQTFRSSRRAIAIALAAPIAFSACSTRTVLKQNPQPKTSYELRVPKNAARYSGPPGTVVIQPIAILPAHPAPEYPPALLRAGAPSVIVVAQLVIDTEGRVTGVFPVPGTDKTPGHELYEQAVEQAALRWKFTPLLFRAPNGDGAYTEDAKPFSLWYVFHFDVVNGKPIVETVKR